MAETSYIIQNGRRLNLKDASARKSIGSCEELKTETKHCLVSAINELCQKIDEGGGGTSFTTDETLTLKDGVLSVNTANVAEADDARPITSAAVHATVSNKANKSDLASHIRDTTTHVTATERTAWNNKISAMENTTLGNDISTTWTMYNDRHVTITGNDITMDMSGAAGGWAGTFAGIKDPSGNTTTMLGIYGGESGLTHIFMGGAYYDPAMKMTPDGQFTFKNAPMVGSDTVALQSAVDSKAATSDLTNHTSNTTAHITAAERTAWNGKLDKVGALNNLNIANSFLWKNINEYNNVFSLGENVEWITVSSSQTIRYANDTTGFTVDDGGLVSATFSRSSSGIGFLRGLVGKYVSVGLSSSSGRPYKVISVDNETDITGAGKLFSCDITIQEVAGRKINKYYLSADSGEKLGDSSYTFVGCVGELLEST